MDIPTQSQLQLGKTTYTVNDYNTSKTAYDQYIQQKAISTDAEGKKILSQADYDTAVKMQADLDVMATTISAEQEEKDRLTSNLINSFQSYQEYNEKLPFLDIDPNTPGIQLSQGAYNASQAKLIQLKNKQDMLESETNWNMGNELNFAGEPDSSSLSNLNASIQKINDVFKKYDLTPSTSEIDLYGTQIEHYNAKQAKIQEAINTYTATENKKNKVATDYLAGLTFPGQSGMLGDLQASTTYDINPEIEQYNKIRSDAEAYLKNWDLNPSTPELELAPEVFSAYNIKINEFNEAANLLKKEQEMLSYYGFGLKPVITDTPSLSQSNQMAFGSGVVAPGYKVNDYGQVVPIVQPTFKPYQLDTAKDKFGFYKVAAQKFGTFTPTVLTGTGAASTTSAENLLGISSTGGTPYLSSTNDFNKTVAELNKPVVQKDKTLNAINDWASTGIVNTVNAFTANPVKSIIDLSFTPLNVAKGVGEYIFTEHTDTQKFMEKETGYKDPYAQIYTAASDKATAAAKEAKEFYNEKGLFGTGLNLGSGLGDTIYGFTQATQTAINASQNAATDFIYDITKNEELARGGGYAASLPVAIVPYVLAPEVSVPFAVGSTLTSKSVEEAALNIGMGVGFGAFNKSIEKGAGVVIPMLEAAPITQKIVSTGASLAIKAPAVYYGGLTVLGGAEASLQAAAGDTKSADEFREGLQKAFAGGVIGMPIGSALVTGVTAAPKIAVATARTLNEGKLLDPMAGFKSEYGYSDLSWVDTAPAKIKVEGKYVENPIAEFNLKDVPALKAEGVDIVMNSPGAKITDIWTSDLISFKESLANPQQKAQIISGEAISLPQGTSISKTIGEAYTGKVAEFYKMEYPDAFKADEALLARTSQYSLEGKPKITLSEEPATYFGTDISTIGLPGVKSEGQTSVPNYSLLGGFEMPGKILISQPESVGKFPTNKTYSNLTAKDVVSLREIGGVDYGKILEVPKYEVPGKVFSGKDIQGQEITKMLGGGRPLKGKFVEMSITGKKLATGTDPLYLKAFGEPKLTPGKAYTSIPETLARGRAEKEILTYNTEFAKFEPVPLRSKGKLENIFKVPDALVFLKGNAYAVEGSKYIKDPNMIFKVSPETKELTNYEKIKRNILGKDDVVSRGEIRYNKSIIPDRYINVSPSVSRGTSAGNNISREITSGMDGLNISSGIVPSRNTSDIYSGGSSVLYISPSISSSFVDISPSISSSFFEPTPSRTSTSDVSRDITSGITSMGSSASVSSSSVSSPSRSEISRSRSMSTSPSSGRRYRPSSRSMYNLDSYSDKKYYAPSYDVYVRKGMGSETGKKRKVQEVLIKKGLPYGAAANLGLGIADQYSQRTAILKPSKKPSMVPDELVNKSLLQQFRPLSLRSKIPQSKQSRTFVEKSRYAIDTLQEKKGIPYKAAAMAKARKNVFGSFGGMRI